MKKVMFFLNLFLSLFLSFFLVSCGKDIKPPTVVTFQTPSSLAVDTQDGGIMIYGRGPDSHFALGLQQNGESRTVTLKSGDWKFFAIGWEGPKKLQGITRCAILQKSLTGGQAQVDLTLTSTQCQAAQEFGTSSAHRNGSQFLGLRIVSCNHLGHVAGPTDLCINPLENLGNGQSFRLVLMEMGAGRGEVRALTGPCEVRPSDPPGSHVDFPVNIPVTGIHPELFRMAIVSYRDTQCTEEDDEVSTFLFPNGLLSPGVVKNEFFAHGASLESKVFLTSEGGVNKAVLFLADNEFGTGGSPFLDLRPSIICGSKGSGPGCMDYNTANSTNPYYNAAFATRILVWNITGSPDGKYPQSGGGGGGNNQSNRPFWGLLGEIRRSMSADGIGGFLFKEKGLQTCSSLPANATYEATVKDDHYRIVISPGQTMIPPGYTGAGSTFQKRISFYENGVISEIKEFNCTGHTKVGWQRNMKTDEKDEEDDLPIADRMIRNYELIYDGTVSTAFKAESYNHSYYLDKITHPAKELRALKFTSTSTSFSVYETTVRNSTSNDGATYQLTSQRMGVKYAWGTSNPLSMFFSLNLPASTAFSTATADIAETELGELGDINDWDSELTPSSIETDSTTSYSSSHCVSLTTNNVTTGCSTIDDPGKPWIDTSVTGNFSILWVGSTACPTVLTSTGSGLACKLSSMGP